MNELQAFSNDEFGAVRALTIDNEPWFVGKDVAVALGYSNTNDALKKHIDDEDKIVGSQNATPSITDSFGRVQYPTFINESGVYSLIFGSKLDSAKRFKHWVTHDVLPALRQTGHYEMQTVEMPELTKDDYLRAASILSTCRRDRMPQVTSLLEQAGFTLPKVTKQEKAAQIGVANDSPIVLFVESVGEDDINGHTTAEVYADYKKWCKENNSKPMPHNVFSRVINQLIDSEVRQRKINGKNCKVFMR